MENFFIPSQLSMRSFVRHGLSRLYFELRGFALKTGGLVSMLLLSTTCSYSGEAEIDVHTNQPASLSLPWLVDEQDLQDPRGYNRHGASAWKIARRLTIENTGQQPLVDIDLVVNGRDWSTETGLLAQSGATKNPAALFPWWTQVRSHAASGSRAAEDPLQMLRFWGYTLCGEDTRALARLFAALGVEARQIPLNGHVAAEYLFAGKWNLFDGDQNIAYLALDNTALASYAEVRADPFLAMRTKPFGRYATWSVEAAQFNSGLLERIDSAEPKPLRFKPKNMPSPPGKLILFPGEQLIFHYDKVPPLQAGKADAPEWRKAAPSALRVVELRVLPSARGWHSGPLTVETNYPIVPGLQEPATKTDTLRFQAVVAPVAAATPISVWMQASQVSLGSFAKGANHVLLRSANAGAARVGLDFETSGIPPQPAAPLLHTDVGTFVDRSPTFRIDLEEGADRIWWQILAESQLDSLYPFVAPSLDQVEAARNTLQLDALASTFLQTGSRYRLRMKCARKGVWSSWSQPLLFAVEKAAPAQSIKVTSLESGKVRLEWTGDAADYSIYGSNRVDFLPEIYTEKEVISMRGLEELRSRPNKNLLGTVTQRFWEGTPTARFVRIIGKRGDSWSNPSALITLPAASTSALQPPTVFQVRWKIEDGKDFYEGEERELPH